MGVMYEYAPTKGSTHSQTRHGAPLRGRSYAHTPTSKWSPHRSVGVSIPNPPAHGSMDSHRESMSHVPSRPHRFRGIRPESEPADVPSGSPQWENVSHTACWEYALAYHPILTVQAPRCGGGGQDRSVVGGGLSFLFWGGHENTKASIL